MGRYVLGNASLASGSSAAWQGFMTAHANALNAAAKAMEAVRTTWVKQNNWRCVIGGKECEQMYELAKQNVKTLALLPGALQDAVTRGDPGAFTTAGDIIAQAKDASNKYLSWANDSGVQALFEETLKQLEIKMTVLAEAVGAAAANAFKSAAKGAFNVSPLFVALGVAGVAGYVWWQWSNIKRVLA